ncbi:MAG: hypothetical protein R6X33_15965 [Candidatus Brocadiia bacterium]
MSSFDYEVECPECGAAFAVPRIRIGREESCPVCRATVRVSAPGEAATTVSAGRDAEEIIEPDRPRGRTAGPARSLVSPHGRGRCLVCVRKEQKINPIDAGPIVETFTRMPRIEARMQVHQGMGILAEGVSADTGHNMARELQEKDIEACVVPETVLERMGRELPLVRIYDADASALHVQVDDDGALKAVPWGSVITGVCVEEQAGGRTSRLEVRDQPGFVGTRMGMGMYRTRYSGVRLTSESHKPELRVTLVLLRQTTGELYLLSFGEEQVRYAYLGDRLQASRRQNLGLVIGDIMKFAEGAFFPASFQEAASGKIHRARKVSCRVEAQNCVRWAVCCAAARGLLGDTAARD